MLNIPWDSHPLGKNGGRLKDPSLRKGVLVITLQKQENLCNAYFNQNVDYVSYYDFQDI